MFFCNQYLHECSCENQSYLKILRSIRQVLFTLFSFESICWVKTTQKTSRTSWISKQNSCHTKHVKNDDSKVSLMTTNKWPYHSTLQYFMTLSKTHIFMTPSRKTCCDLLDTCEDI